jgi:hypothetical protein
MIHAATGHCSAFQKISFDAHSLTSSKPKPRSSAAQGVIGGRLFRVLTYYNVILFLVIVAVMRRACRVKGKQTRSIIPMLHHGCSPMRAPTLNQDHRYRVWMQTDVPLSGRLSPHFSFTALTRLQAGRGALCLEVPPFDALTTVRQGGAYAGRSANGLVLGFIRRE